MIFFLIFSILFSINWCADCAHKSRISNQDSCNDYTGCSWDSSISKCKCSSKPPNDVLIIFDEVNTAGRNFMRNYLPSLMDLDTTRVGIIEPTSTSNGNFVLTQEMDYYTSSAIRDRLGASSKSQSTPLIRSALDIALQHMKTKQNSKRNRIIFLISDGHESETPLDPENYYEVCHEYADKFHEAADNIYILRHSIYYWNRAINCLTHKSYGNIYHLINLKFWAQFYFWWSQFKFCPVNNMPITEVQANPSMPRYVEFYNQGNDIYLKDFAFSGLVESVLDKSVNTLYQVKQDTYFVLFIGDISCETCGCDKQTEEGKTKWCKNVMYIRCCDSNNSNNVDSLGNECICRFNSNMGNTNWHQNVYRLNGLSHDKTLINQAKYDIQIFPQSAGTTNPWEIIDRAYSADNGSNWRSNCKTTGSPGNEYQPGDC